MAKANITEKKSVSIKGVLNVDKADNTIVVELEDGEAMELASILQSFDGVEVAMSVTNSVDIA